MTNVSAVILTKNEEEAIRSCIRSLAWCDEIIVIDDYSDDNTVEIAASEGGRVFKRKLNNDFASQRNYAFSKVNTKWVLFLDADERVEKPLADAILTRIQNTSVVGFRIPRVTVWEGKKMRFGEFFQFSLLRLGRKGTGKWVGKVHERWEIDGDVESIRIPIIHDQRGGVNEFLRRINYYSTLRADELYELQKKSHFFEILLMPIFKFCWNYFFRLGLLDGTAGLINAIGMSFYTFLVRAKVWLLWNDAEKKV
ncbi:MAG: hypothetical protein RLZZ455_1023 [Candidatus Parcubacteria bacterium]